MNHALKRSAALVAGIVVLLCACANLTRSAKNEDANQSITFRDPADFVGVFFKPARPLPDDGISLAVLASPAGEAALENDLELLKQAPAEIRLRTVGYTDTHECSGYECVRLSLRRADFIHRWLIANGIPETRLDPPKG